MKPNFFWVGQGKAGSSLTFRVLARHPDVFMGEQKEHNVFRRPVNRQVALDHYAQAAAGRAQSQQFGDVSPSYYDRPVRIDRIANFYKGEALPKIIFCLRHPVSFAVSRYHQVLKVGKFLGSDELDTLGGPDNICLLTYEADFRGTYEFEPKIHRALGIESGTRYYDQAKDAQSNPGVRPWFDLSGLSAGQATFCSAPNRSRVFSKPTGIQIAQMERANDNWQRPLSQTFGNSLSVWDSPPSLTPYPKAAPHAAALT